MYFIVKKCHVQYQILQPSPPQAVPPAPGGENGTVGGCVINGYACNAGYVKWQGKCTKECAASNTAAESEPPATYLVRQQDGSCKPCDTGTLPFSSNPAIEPQQCVSEYDIENAVLSAQCTSIDTDGTIAGCVKPYYACKTGYVKYGEECKQQCDTSDEYRKSDGSCGSCETDYGETYIPSSSSATMEPQECYVPVSVSPPPGGWGAVVIPGDGTWINPLTGNPVLDPDAWNSYFGLCGQTIVYLATNRTTANKTEKDLMNLLIQHLENSVEASCLSNTSALGNGDVIGNKRPVIQLVSDGAGGCRCPSILRYGNENNKYYFSFKTETRNLPPCLSGMEGYQFWHTDIQCEAIYQKEL